jgi:hypothetical protein
MPVMDRPIIQTITTDGSPGSPILKYDELEDLARKTAAIRKSRRCIKVVIQRRVQEGILKTLAERDRIVKADSAPI